MLMIILITILWVNNGENEMKLLKKLLDFLKNINKLDIDLEAIKDAEKKEFKIPLFHLYRG